MALLHQWSKTSNTDFAGESVANGYWLRGRTEDEHGRNRGVGRGETEAQWQSRKGVVLVWQMMAIILFFFYFNLNSSTFFFFSNCNIIKYAHARHIHVLFVWTFERIDFNHIVFLHVVETFKRDAALGAAVHRGDLVLQPLEGSNRPVPHDLAVSNAPG